MNDTSPDMLSRFHHMIMEKSPEERLRMGCSMFDTAKQIVISSIREQRPQLTPQQMRSKIFLRFYGGEFSHSDKKKILSALKMADDIS